MSIVKYKNYCAKIEYDPDDCVLVGTVIDTIDSLSFQADTPAEVMPRFKQCVEEYLDFCSRSGKEPEKSYTGQFNVRIRPSLHRLLAYRAALEGVSLNRVVEQALSEYVEEHK